MDLEWTLVQRKRHPKRGQNQGVGGFRTGARAGWGRNPEPVPPHQPTGFGYPGSFPRTYAQVVRGKEQNVNHMNQNKSFYHNKKTPRYIKPDQHFKNMIHKFHLLIKMLHHEENVKCPEEGNQPKIIQHMINMLSTLIKPAMPNQKTMDYIDGNAREWGHTTEMILQQHYEEQITNLQSQIGEYYLDEWEEPFKVAVGWSKKKLPRLREATLEKARQIIVAAVRDRHSHSSQSDSDPDLGHDPIQNLESPGPQLQESLNPFGPEPLEARDTPGPQPPAAEDISVPENKNKHKNKKTTQSQKPKKTTQQEKTTTLFQWDSFLTMSPNLETQEPAGHMNNKLTKNIDNNIHTCETNSGNRKTRRDRTNTEDNTTQQEDSTRLLVRRALGFKNTTREDPAFLDDPAFAVLKQRVEEIERRKH